MYVHQAAQTTQAETSDRWREAVRERWRVTLLSAWERDAGAANGMVASHGQKVIFLRPKTRLNRNQPSCK